MCTFQSILWGMDWESYRQQAEKAMLFEYGWSCSFREKETELYVRGDCVLTADCDRVIVCWQQIVIGWLDKGWEGKGIEWGNCETFAGKFRWRIWREDNIKPFVLFKDLKCDINKNNVWLFERHKHSSIPNTIILTHWGQGHLNCLNARYRGF